MKEKQNYDPMELSKKRMLIEKTSNKGYCNGFSEETTY